MMSIRMNRRWGRFVKAVWVAALCCAASLPLDGCWPFGSGVGACVSDAVKFEYLGLRVYCYSYWDESDCTEHQQSQVNGANWTFYEGQTCSDRGLVDGSNPWP